MNLIGSGIELELVPVACAVCGSSDPNPTPVFEGYDFEYRTCDNKFRFVACAECGHVYLSPGLKHQDIDRIYPKKYLPRSITPAYPAFRPVRWLKTSVFDRGWIRTVLSGLRERSNVLEIGAGSGSQLTYLASITPFPIRLHANELVFDPAVRASLRARSIEMLEGPLERLVCPVRFDAIICMHVIEHVFDPEKMWEWISEHLAPGGILYLESPDLNAPARYLFRNYWASLSFPRHFHLFSRSILAGLVRSNRLEIVSHHAVVEASAWIVSIRNRLGFNIDSRRKGLLSLIGYKSLLSRTVFSAIDLMCMMLGCSTSTQALIARKPEGDG